MSDTISPKHYQTSGGIECIDYIESAGWGAPFCAGNVVKYITRYPDKDGAKDVRKALWYCARLLCLITHKGETAAYLRELADAIEAGEKS